jgi:F-box protein 20
MRSADNLTATSFFTGRGAAMIIESLRLFYHIDCFKCCVCHVQLGDGLMGTDVRVRNNKLHCHNCYSSDDGKF